MPNKHVFYIIGVLQAFTLGLALFFLLRTTGIPILSVLALSVLFPLTTLILEYLIYSRK